MSDNVNHPHHYEGSTSIECIEAMVVAFGKEATYHFCKGNAFKYVWRHKNKNGIEDLNKAQWYIDRCRKFDMGYDEQLEELQRLISINLLHYVYGGDKIGIDKKV